MSVLLNSAKGRLTEGLIATLLEHAGYRVSRLGVEEQLDEIRYAGGAVLSELNLPQQFWSLPDLLVVRTNPPGVVMLEVKFRKTFDEPTAKALSAKLREQQGFWPATWTAVVVARPPEGMRGNYYQDHIRVLRPEDLSQLQGNGTATERWRRLPTLGSAFLQVHETPDFHREMDRLLPVLRALAEV